MKNGSPYIALKSVRSPHYEILLGEERPQRGRVLASTYTLADAVVEATKEEMCEHPLVQ